MGDGQKEDIRINLKVGLSINIGNVIKEENGVLNQERIYFFT